MVYETVNTDYVDVDRAQRSKDKLAGVGLVLNGLALGYLGIKELVSGRDGVPLLTGAAGSTSIGLGALLE